MNKSLIGAVAVLLIAGLVGFTVFSSGDDDTDVTNNTESTVQETAGSDADENNSDEPENIEQITAATVAMHAEESDCWTIIGASVYDITSYVPRHPGGDEILRACGADGTSLFAERTTNDGETVGSGTAHSGNATSQLQSLFLGKLAE